MRMEQGVRTGLGHGGITCVLQTQFSSLLLSFEEISLKNNEKIFMNIVCCNRDWRFKG